ncbi:sulfotransferase family 2 domain-containing protein [Roseisalinus antarcticus]|uniref:Uncharacterized protein n=1 Tax=Roseisalinus antarcticus TaxID=254357 RepID=A0A1Y5TQH2_9RHOB|nr:sulfotransferase family 2 domain-containing protein [Roseisalinus antarcticus]SLN69135.1 hypothetical protein ROA7023_03359 [Roseisalinus antarcticus]
MQKILRPDLIPYDLIGRLETFDRDLAQVNARLGHRLSENYVFAPLKTGSSTKTDTYYTPEIRKQVEEIYACDLDAFGY